MPLIKLKHVVSFSSEDTSHPTSNLLKPENYRKWRCAEPGGKQAVVVLEFEKATKIHSIDIGNNGSALIEVLVGRSSDSSENFKVILVTSSFMTPAESKSFTSTNRVRMFGPDKLSKPVADEKWDRVKVVCTQPFNKHERYGLSFVSLHSPPEDSAAKDDKDAIPTPKRLGSFTLRDEEEDAITPGSLFLKKKMASPPAASTAALVRDASTSSSNEKTSVGDTFRNRQPVASKLKEEKEPTPVKQDPKPVKQDSKPVKPDRPAKPVTPVTKDTTKRKHDTTSEEKPSKSASSSRSTPPQKRKKTSTQPSANVPFNQMLKGVVFVLSGFKNPKRGDLRDKALEMGAQYKPDWMSGCTHLICAFSNTPKYNQVKGKGKIVTEKWINECYRKKRKLPTRNFHLPGDTSSTEESTEEEEEEVEEQKEPSTSHKKQHSSPPTKDESKSDNVSRNSPSEEPKSTEDNKKNQIGGPSIPKKKGIVFDESTDDEKEKEDLPTKEESASDQDTEDELEKIHQTERKENSCDENDDDDDDDIYDKSTEDEEEEEEDVKSGPESGSEGLPELPDFLSHKHFLLYGEMDQPTRRSLIRYITAYNGILEEYMNDTVDFVVTDEKWDQNFEDALSENASLAFVRPKWIFTCHEKLKLVPFQPYIITPS
ncbi:DNA repair protein XRCC1-like [Actinia tenebrosa]|uniref:DNA repair protein XRCC1 n=1 Tax=Actinia tenebrosa TaxID=6105 RepID=A0A6P8HCG2_ACTTE|nr:DNA repair protein XRCC1-like [Actinia tenebrosa]